jgi:Tol biopolymer transport system component
MTVESRQPDWGRVKDVLQMLLESPAGERARLARQACSDDEPLLAEVESLLAAHERAGHFAERPALQLLAESDDPRDTSSPPSPLLQPGDRLGPYEIQECLGIGGMGEVYKAVDARLQRVVAIKVLRSRAAEPEHREQFEREARLIAKLGHPQICVLHDIGSEGPLAYLVMEYLDGETLAERLARGVLPLDESIRYSFEIVAALRETHRHGIVHRDIKPSNIMLTSKGAKLLDFGVAKQFMMAALASDAEVTGALSATSLSSIFGTPLYMAPEQLRGGHADHRADIFAFGAVLYEMITGRKAFHGDTFLSAVIAVREEQPPALSTDDSPQLEGLDKVVLRCLAKNPADRWQSADELERALFEVMATGSGARRGPAKGALQRKRLTWSLAAVLALAAAVTMWPRPERPAQTTVGSSGAQPRLVLRNVRMLTGDERIEIDPAFSPDGNSVAYAGGAISGGQILIRPIDGGPSIPLNRAGRFEFQPQWSRDGKQLLYIGTGGLFVASSAGGDARRLLDQTVYTEPADVLDTFNGFSAATWSHDGRHLAIVENSDKVLSIVSVDDGRRRTVTKFDAPLHSCDWSANRRWLACTSGNWVSAAPGLMLGNSAPSTIVIIDVDDGDVREVTDRLSSNQSPVWAADSQSLYFVSNRSGPYDIYAVAIGDDGTPLAAPSQLTTGLGAYAIDFSTDGKRLAYAAYSARSNIWSIPIPSEGVVDVSAARQLTTANQMIEAMRVSRDRKWLLYDSNLTGNFEIYRVPVDGGTSERLTTAPSEEFAADLSTDGRYLAYFSWRTKSRDVFVQPLDGGPVEQVTHTPSHEAYPAWSPDGRTLVFWDNSDDRGAFRGIFSTRRDSTGRWEPPKLLRAGGVKPSWSPDGRFILYTRAGGIEMLSLDSGQHRVLYSKINGVGAEEALLSEDGKTVYFKTHDDVDQRAQFWAVPLDGKPARLLVHFTDPARRSNRTDFAVGAGRFYFAIDERRSNIWLADVTETTPPR